MKNVEKDEEEHQDGEASEGADLAGEAGDMELPSEDEEEEEDNRIVNKSPLNLYKLAWT